MTRIGIDLGTTNSLVAYWAEEEAKVIPNILGKNLTPSVISLDDNGEILIGDIAKERLITHPHSTVSNFKRDMGTGKIYKLGTNEFTPTELSSLILRSLKEDAEAYLGEEVNEAIISVPAYFSDIQRKATQQAAELAGLRVDRLISEPTAAAIAYGLDNINTDLVFLVFDLGGGTFDVSILELFDDIMQVRSVAGDNYIGGEDFTKVIYNYFINHNNIDRKLLDRKVVSRLKKIAEECKILLSEKEEYEMVMSIDDKEYRTTITRGLFEKLCNNLIQRLMQPMARALRDADITIDDLDAVILMGGATRMPIIKNIVSKVFKMYPYANINPDETVSIGAALQAALKNRDEGLKEIILTDVCPYTLGIEVLKDRYNNDTEEVTFSPIIDRNSPIPVSRVERYNTVYDNQTSMRIKVYQGENRKPSNNIFLGDVEISVPPRPAGEERVDVRFTYDINGLLEVQVTSLSTMETKSTVINNYNNNLSEKELNKRKKILDKLKIHPRDRMENRLLLAKADRLYEECLGDVREYIADCISEFEKVLISQNELRIKEASERFKAEIKKIEEFRDVR